MITFPNAKINLGLNITEKRSDGFHNLESVFYPVQWNDALEILPSADFKFTSSGINIPGDAKSNLCIQVFESLKKDFNLSPIHIHLHKNIPIGAGLGGGSSDAAFTAKAINQIFELALSDEQLEDYVRVLGSDCAFFVKNKPVLAYEKGDRFENITLNLSGKYIVLVYPEIHISTREAYSGVLPGKAMVSVKDAVMKDISEWKNNLKNDFENSILSKYPAIENIKNNFYKEGALYASMSGSGSAVYGIFEKLPPENLFQNYKSWIGNL